MNKEESLALYAQGRDAWNAWANKMLAEKAELEKNGQWRIDIQATKDWMEASSVDFSERVFDELMDFSGFIFPNIVYFKKIRFKNYVIFNRAIFSSFVTFDGTIFSGAATFENTIFSLDANFNETIFSRIVSFYETTFSGNAIFSRALFAGFVVFTNTTFERNSSFLAIEGKSRFSFKNAKFHIVPDFNQAHFTEAPQFDDVDFSKALNNSQSESEENFSSRWRALKRLAIQGHDHERELMFFAEEIKSQRGIQDKAFPNPVNYFNNEPVWPGGARYWLGYLYQVLSDFGRSVMRPIFWLLFFGFLFQVLYLNYPIDPEHQETIICNRSEAAIYLSVRSALPFLPAAIYPENLSRNYECLYGTGNIPSVIVFITIFQAILSTILIFLLLLALRNYFRIK